ncbi:sulfite exporter TauE/SafE family protein [Acetobacter sp. UBA5411]|uniref:sulfite exporter TauE/SafE family protein n=1 Tax=Acetobacter sp. UBA5411 TaxID=1945905 RepID=UPI0025C172FA|nr:sulfite exporter TauE/SafE family protein [Acetobacter sp. UBA5411]
MQISMSHVALEILSGVPVGFTLGLIGGGGSILAVPLMVYLVGVKDPHVAIGTSALAVAVNALAGLVQHARSGTVQWRCAAVFAPCGMVGAIGGAWLGKAMDGQKLLLLFAFLMIGVGITMLRGRRKTDCEKTSYTPKNMVKIASFGTGTGLLSGFFGIGGGFLIVPGLMASTHMPIINAVSTSLVAVAAFGFSTALSYLLSGYIDWGLAIFFILGGIIGTYSGSYCARVLCKKGDQLTTIFSSIIFVVAAYMIWRGFQTL